MTRLKSALCASLLTVALSSAAFAGEITGKASMTTSSPSISVTKTGEITGRNGEITGSPLEAIAIFLGIIALLP